MARTTRNDPAAPAARDRHAGRETRQDAPRDRSSRTAGQPRPGEGAHEARAVASYIYGILPGDVELTPEPRGVGDPPGRTRLVRHDDIAALVSDLHLTRPLGRPDDLVAHQRLLDDVAAEVPVLPLRFGAVMENPEAIVRELLAPHREEFRSALRHLEGCAQFLVKGRYEEDTVLREVLRERPEAVRLREEVRDLPEDASWDARIRLGEVINRAIEEKRDIDTETLAEGLAPHAVAIVIREPTHEQDAAHLAVLVETARRQEFENALEEFARRWEGRVTLRLIGPQAAYDFVTTQ